MLPWFQEILFNIRSMLSGMSFVVLYKGPFTLCVFFWQFVSNEKNGFHTHSLHLTQHPIDAMLQFDANTNANTNLDANVNEP